MRAFILWAAVSGAVLGQEADALLRAAVSLARHQQLDQAQRVLLDGRRRFPQDTRFLQELAGVEYRRKNPARAKRYLRAALAQAPQDAYAADFLASLYLLDGNLPAALKYWNRIDKPLVDSVQFAPEPALDPLLRDRALAVSGGQLLTLERLARTETNLGFLGVFADWRFDLAPRPGRRSDLFIRATPKSLPVARWSRLLLPLRGLPYRQVNLDFNNLRGRAVNFASLWRWDPQKRRIALDLSGPAGNWRYRWLFDARDETWDLGGPVVRSNLKLARIETGGDLSRVLTGKLVWTTGLRLAARRFQNGGDGAYFANGWTTEIRNRFEVPVWSWPDERLRVDASATIRTGRIVSRFPSRLLSAQGQVKAHWLPQANRDTYSVAADFQMGAISGNVPLDELFILGMERDNPLWLRGHAGTRDGRKGSAPMGTRFVLARLELDREVFRLPFVRFRVGPFFDSGRVDERGWLLDAGVQAKLGTIGGVTFTAVYGRSLRDGRAVFYTALR